MMVEKTMSANPEQNPISIQPPIRGERPTIIFSDDDYVGVALPHEDALVIQARIDVQNVRRILVDPGSSMDIIYKNLFDKMREVKLEEINHAIYAWSGQASWPLGMATLNVKLGPKTVKVNFMVVDFEGPYNAILGRRWIGAMKAVPSTTHQKLKFICDEGIVTV